MVSGGGQALGFALAGVGSAGVVLICVLPMWKVTVFIYSNIVTAQVLWEGLWMNCVKQTGQMQCKAYDPLLALPQDLQAARTLVVVSIAVAVAAALLGVAGASCTNFLRRDAAAKACMAAGSGVAFIAAGVLCLVPVCWTTSTLVTGFYNPLVSTGQERELGIALYVGWIAWPLLILGGAILISTCTPDPAPHPRPETPVGVGVPRLLHAPTSTPQVEQKTLRKRRRRTPNRNQKVV